MKGGGYPPRPPPWIRAWLTWIQNQDQFLPCPEKKERKDTYRPNWEVIQAWYNPISPIYTSLDPLVLCNTLCCF